MRLVHSYSALKLYEQCPLRYYRQRIVKDVHERDTKYTTHGNVVHKAIEDNINANTPFPTELSVYAGPTNAIRRSVRDDQRVVCEKSLGLDRAYGSTGYWDNAIWIRAKIDVLVHGGKSESAVVFDWKTGKRKVDFTQLKIATLATFAAYTGVESVRAAFIWLKDKIMDKVTYTRSQTSVLIAEIEPRLLAIEEAQAVNVWTPKPSYLCNYCPCKPTCPYSLK